MSLCTARVAPEKAVFRPVLPLHVQPEFTGEHDMAHGAIETTYKGCRFRSRLEARWAVFFDALGIDWKYETQGYEVDDHRYLPDFYLPGSNDWVEVKGDPEGLRTDTRRMRAILGSDSPLPGVNDGKSGLLVLGDVPLVPDGTAFHPFLAHRGGKLVRLWSFFGPSGADRWSLMVADPSILFRLFGVGNGGEDLNVDPPSDAWVVTCPVIPTKAVFRPVLSAYSDARRARFEHGESGRGGTLIRVPSEAPTIKKPVRYTADI